MVEPLAAEKELEDLGEIDAPRKLPPTGVILDAQECTLFRKMWTAGNTIEIIADHFVLDVDEAHDIRRRLGLPDRKKS